MIPRRKQTTKRSVRKRGTKRALSSSSSVSANEGTCWIPLRRCRTVVLLALSVLCVVVQPGVVAALQVAPTTVRHAPFIPTTRTTATSQLAAILTRDNTSGTCHADKEDNNHVKIPFIIEQVPKRPPDRLFREIARVCIDAFFNDSTTAGGGRRQKNYSKRVEANGDTATPPWKQYQLSYLRALQQADLRRRRLQQSECNMMFVARRVLPVTNDADWKTAASLASWQESKKSGVGGRPLILDLSKVQNLGYLDKSAHLDYVQGPIVGFAEVTLKPYGLGSIGSDEDAADVPMPKRNGNTLNRWFTQKRPILTNLSVRHDARHSGIGSALLQTCEQQVSLTWKRPEMILEVEDDNENAILFYQHRHYKILFDDSTSRRYDTTGFWLQQKRCRRHIMRKQLSMPSFLGLPTGANYAAASSSSSSSWMPVSFWMGWNTKNNGVVDDMNNNSKSSDDGDDDSGSSDKSFFGLLPRKLLGSLLMPNDKNGDDGR